MSCETRNRTVLGADCRIQGELWLENDATLLGRFDGHLHVIGSLELGPASQTTGKIETRQLKLAGRVQGDLIADESIELMPGAAVIGRLFTPRLLCGENALIQGQVYVGPSAMAKAKELAGESLASAPTTSAQPAISVQGDLPVAVMPTVMIPHSLKNVLQSRKTLKIIHGAQSAANATTHAS